MKKQTAALRWARAVTLCISMVFISSRGWSRLSQVSYKPSDVESSRYVHSRGIDDLIPEVLVVQVTNEQTLGCLSIVSKVPPRGSIGKLTKAYGSTGVS